MKMNQCVTLCGETLSGPRHICAFFDSREEQYEVLVPFFKEGLNNNEEVITIWEGDLHDELRLQFSKAGIAVPSRLANGQLKLFASNETYTKDNMFVSERMLSTLDQALAAAHDGPYGSARACGDMEWALKNLPGTDELMEYEAKINLLTPKYDCTVVCAYDITRFSGRMIADVLASHSHVILNGRIHCNPHFIEPFELLKKLAQRRNYPLKNESKPLD